MRPAALAPLVAVAAVVATLAPAPPAGAAISAAVTVAQPVATLALHDPTALTATETACTPQTGVEVTIAWQADTTGAIGVEVRRSDDGGASYTVLATVPPEDTAWVDATATFSVSYLYSVVTRRGPWTGPGAVTASVTTSPKGCAAGGGGGGGPGGPGGGGGRP